MPSKQQLQEWYKKFSEILLKNADIDVTKAESLGCVKNIQITKWDTTNPDKPDIRVSYAYANEGVTPFSDAASKADHDKWMNENLKPAVTDEQILRLYNMSLEGTLMITSPQTGLRDIQMVRTEPDGTIVTSLPASAYLDGGNEKLPEENQIPQKPQEPAYSLNPEDYGIAPRPVAPQEPANMDPSIWSIIAYWLFRVDNDYAKLRQYNLDKMAYDEAAAKWDRAADHAETRIERNAATGEEKTVDYEEFRIARNAHELYSQQFASYQNDPLAKFSAIANSAKALMTQTFWKSECNSLDFMFRCTPRGKAKAELDSCTQKLDFEKRTDTMLHNWLGHDADPVKTTQYFAFNLYGIRIKPLELPKSPDPAQAQRMSDLFDLAALSATADPDITAPVAKPGKTRQDTAANTFNHILNDMVTSGRSDLRGYYQHIEPAREKALSVLEAYSQGNKGPLAEMLGLGMRNLIKNGRQAGEFSTHAVNTIYMIGKMYNVLQEDKDLLQASGLTEEDLQEAKAHMELYQFIRKGIQAKKDILDHTFENRTLTPDQLQKAAGDVLLFHHVMLGLAAGYKKNEQALYESEAYKQLENSLTVPKDVNDPSKGTKPADMETFERVKNQMDVMGNNLPANDFTMGLLDKEGVKQYMQDILEKTDFSKLGDMSREQLRELFSKNNNQIASTLMPAKPKSAPAQEAPVMQKEAPVPNAMG